MKQQEKKNIKNIGILQLEDGLGDIILHRYKYDTKNSVQAIYLTYKGKRRWVGVGFRRYPVGTFNNEITDVPYLVLDNTVYHLSDFTTLEED